MSPVNYTLPSNLSIILCNTIIRQTININFHRIVGKKHEPKTDKRKVIDT